MKAKRILTLALVTPIVLALGALVAAILLPPIGASDIYYSLDAAERAPTDVTKLALIQRGYEEIPKVIGQFPNLEYIVLVDNKLTHVPNWLCEKSKIKILVLAHNEFSQFPSELVAMHGLQSLNLRDNSISELPPTICRLKSLEELDLRNNELAYLPDEISRLTALKLLRLDGNCLSSWNQDAIRRLLPRTRITFGEQRQCSSTSVNNAPPLQ
jgi:Leucine-rich repeat (LRR) protein